MLVPSRRGEVARPDPGRQDHLIGLSAALIGHHNRFAVAGKLDRAHAFAPDLAALFPQQRGQSRDQPVRVDDMPGIRRIDAAAHDRPQRRFHLAHLVAAQLVEMDAALAADRQTVLVLVPARLGRPDEQPAALGDEVLCAGVAQQRSVRVEDAGAERGTRLADPGRVFGRRIAAVAAEPGDQFRQVAPAQRQRVLRIEQHPRQFPDQAGDREMRVAAEIAGGAEGGRFARSVLVENGDREAVFAQRQRTADADDPGADNDDPLLGRLGAAHRRRPGYQPTA